MISLEARAIVAGIQAGGAAGCASCGQSITQTNPRRGAWCAACEMQELDDGLGRNGAVSNNRKSKQ